MAGVPDPDGDQHAALDDRLAAWAVGGIRVVLAVGRDFATKCVTAPEQEGMIIAALGADVLNGPPGIRCAEAVVGVVARIGDVEGTREEGEGSPRDHESYEFAEPRLHAAIIPRPYQRVHNHALYMGGVTWEARLARFTG